MRQEEIDTLNVPYTIPKGTKVDRRFHSSIGADVPSAAKLAKEIVDDLDTNSFGVSWWKSLPTEERILISDYLYQCADAIEANLVEAKLHYFEWLDARKRGNERIVDSVSTDAAGELRFKMPPATRPLDDLPNKLQTLHICGFFRAVGSSLDCLGAVIIGVLGLPTSLRRCDISKARTALSKVTSSATAGAQLQADFRDFFEQVRVATGVQDWLEWTDQYRNMFVHRGRRMAYPQIVSQDVVLFDSNGQVIPRSTSTLHLAKYPDRSEIEALIKSKDVLLNEDAEVTLNGIFKSCRELDEHTCERLLAVWKERRNNPALIEQPADQWDNKIRSCDFNGYEPNSEQLRADAMIGGSVLFKRMLSASVDDDHRGLWTTSKWNQ
ncbi:MAG TPA: hypothetical protein VJH03_00740 [Blastocatellia bacterium]|nr:hypothetical protein [Blastocatellia bacterium]